jgi:hypothetical protein
MRKTFPQDLLSNVFAQLYSGEHHTGGSCVPQAFGWQRITKQNLDGSKIT